MVERKRLNVFLRGNGCLGSYFWGKESLTELTSVVMVSITKLNINCLHVYVSNFREKICVHFFSLTPVLGSSAQSLFSIKWIPKCYLQLKLHFYFKSTKAEF